MLNIKVLFAAFCLSVAMTAGIVGVVSATTPSNETRLQADGYAIDFDGRLSTTVSIPVMDLN